MEKKIHLCLLKVYLYENFKKIQKLESISIENEYIPGIIKISKIFNTEFLDGLITFQIEGIIYGSYSIYYYVFNEEENENYLDQDKVCMTLQKGNIIKDIFMDNHRFKIYMIIPKRIKVI